MKSDRKVPVLKWRYSGRNVARFESADRLGVKYTLYNVGGLPKTFFHPATKVVKLNLTNWWMGTEMFSQKITFCYTGDVDSF
jgi:hypothetical protein